MKFYFKKIILWLNNGKIRHLDFKPNKVNVITGLSNTGKTEILNIIDYCLFASSPTTSQSVVNENIDWYGILIKINGKDFLIARKSFIQNKASEDYYFTNDDKIPKKPFVNNSESLIKKTLETEFKIDSNVSIPYGSHFLKMGSKISLRYFLMFNTISVNIIENDSGVFFDKQNEPRYRDALPRIFDLAVGIENIENVLKKEKEVELKKKLAKIETQRNIISKKSELFNEEKQYIVRKAKEYSLIDSRLDLSSSIKEIRKVLSTFETNVFFDAKTDKTEQNLYEAERKISNLKRFKQSYTTYKQNLKDTTDSLKPITYLKENDADILKTSVFNDILDSFSIQLLSIKNACKNKTPIDNQVNDEIKELEKTVKELKYIKEQLPENNISFINQNEKYFFLGETKSKLDLYSDDKDSISTIPSASIQGLENQLDELIIIDTSSKKSHTISLIEEIITDYIQETGSVLVNYSTYLPVFDYKNKTLNLRKPKTDYIEKVGSSSNHMFLHLFFTLAMHEVAYINKSPFIAPFIIIDQLSRPYYGTGKTKKKNLNSSDESKVTTAFKLLNNFIQTRNDNDGDFQMIVFEHVPKEIFENLNNVHLVEEFRDGNALIPNSMLERD